MLHHVSFSVHDPERAASVTAQLLAAATVKAPSPPFPEGSRFVVVGDSHGSLIELTPWGTVVGPPGDSLSQNTEMPPLSASHVLMGTPLGSDAIATTAASFGLQAHVVDAGLFRFHKVWIEDSFLLELLSPDQLGDYAACFGGQGAASLNKTLRNLERRIAGLG